MRHSLTPERFQTLAAKIQRSELPLAMRAALRLKLLLEEESIVKNEGERIYAYRTVLDFPDIYLPGEKETLQKGHYIHEQGRVCNISSDWEGVLSGGLLSRKGANEAQDITIDAVLAYADRYEDAALSRAMRTGAKSFLEALQMFRILHFALWASNVYHNTVGRFDQYMYPYFKADMDAGLYTDEQALDLVCEFFLSFNRDSDLYTGMQQGDNGQSMMLGGVTRSGECAVNALTFICLKASLRNKCIDPKINLRVDKNTPMELYRLATELTRQGLGFPQYANDDVVIPALVKWGYALEDARDYTVAACWEFIIPGLGMDIPNISALPLANIVHDVIQTQMKACATFDDLKGAVREAILQKAEAITQDVKSLWMEPAPWQSVLMSDYSHDVSEGAKYNNYGVHTTGFSTAVDQLAAVRWLIYEQGFDKNELLETLDTNFSSHPELRNRLLNAAPKLGRDNACQALADELLNMVADAWQRHTNERGGVFRGGTGSAMYYWWHARELGATADGRGAGEMLAANFSPSLQLTDAGPLSVIRAMARPSLARMMNGGPLTLELHDTVFKNAEGSEKVAMLVRSFILLGGHQLQLNAVSRDTLLDAQAHPEAHKNLIVRVWGWSGHFVQLDKAYQDQIIQRVSYQSA